MSSLTFRPSLTFLPSPAQTCCSRTRRQSLFPPIGPPELPSLPLPFADAGAPALPPHTGGLRTPPADDIMSSTVHHAPPAGPACVSEPYGASYIPDAQRSRIPSADYFRYPQSAQSAAQPPVRPVTNSLPQPQSSSGSQVQPLPYPQQAAQSHAVSQNAPLISLPPTLGTTAPVGPSSSSASSQPNQAGSRHPTHPSTPSTTYSDTSSGRGDSAASMTLHGLQIPQRISPRGGSLSDFAAQTCCFFWFETFDVFVSIDKAIEENRVIPALTKLAVPASGYKKLKHATRTVLPQPGSEYRLLTVALMLGNKFLDDNTYTNKTWAEVSGMTVQEIHVMEVEFLSNMRYNLYVTAKDWEKWLDGLKGVHEYCERAQPRQPSPILVPSPRRCFYQSPVPSPTGSCYSGTIPAATLGSRQSVQGPNWSFSGGSPLSARPTFDALLARKRSFDGDPTEPPAKRVVRPPHPTTTLPSSYNVPASCPPAMAPVSGSQAALHHESMKLPAPALSLNTQFAPVPVSQPTAVTYPAQPTISLPPLNQGARAMSTVYPTTTAAAPPTSSYGPQVNSIVSSSNASASLPAYASGYHTPTKKHSPSNTLHPPFASSPLADGFPSGMHTPISQSPSIYLQQRPSPYRPIRHVNTLLYPPPSASLHEYHLTPSQMHYQPLGRRNDVRTGIVPEYRTLRNPQAPVPTPSNRAPLMHPSLS